MPVFKTSPTKYEIGLGNIEDILNNYVAVVPPTATDDAAAGYQVGSAWIDITTGASWTLADATAGAAIWKPMGYRDPKIITVSTHGNSDFTSVKTAVESITDNTESKPYIVKVAPGQYTESPFSMKPYVTVEGSGYYSTHISTNTPSAHFITGAYASGIERMTLSGPTGAGYATINHADTTLPIPMYIVDVVFEDGYYGVWVHPASAMGSGLTILHVAANNTGTDVNAFLRATDYGRIGGYVVACTKTSTGEYVNGLYTDGANARIVLSDFSYRSSGGTNGIYADNGAYVRITGGLLDDGTNGINIGPSGTRTTIELVAVEFEANFTNDALVQSATGVALLTGGVAPHGNVDVEPGALVLGNYITTDSDNAYADPGSVFFGEVYLGYDAERIPLASYARGTSSTGLVSGGELSIGTGLEIDVAAGSGFIRTATGIVDVSWDAETITVSANKDNYHVVVDINGDVHEEPTTGINLDLELELGAFATNGSSVVGVSQHGCVLLRNVQDSYYYLKETRASAMVSGCATSKNTTPSLQLDVDAGTFYIANYRISVGANAPITMTRWYRDGSTGWTKVTGQTSIDVDKYDDGSGTLADLTTNYYKKDMLYLTGNDGGEEYHYVYSTTEYAAQQGAEDGAEPTAPEFLTNFGIHLSAIVSQESATDITDIIDRRPFPNAATSPTGGGGGVSVHGLLAGLANDDHLQYQLRSEKGAASGYAGLDVSAKVPIAALPNTSASWNASQIQSADVSATGRADGTTIVYRTSTGDFENENLPAADVAYSNAVSGLTAVQVQAAIDEVEGRVDTLEGAPPAHAASHQSGGTDEVATATAAANAIPKALASGVLADAWISATSVTQHVGSIDHTGLLNKGTNAHSVIDTHLGSTSNPHGTTFTQAVTADPGTNITAAEAETLTDGSNADLLHKHTISGPTAAASGLVTTTATSYALMTGMTLTPGAGTYKVMFAAAVTGAKNVVVQMAIFANGVVVSSSQLGATIGNSGELRSITCIATVTVAAGQSISGRWQTTSGTASSPLGRTLSLIRIA